MASGSAPSPSLPQSQLEARRLALRREFMLCSDVVFLNHVLEHVPDDEGALRSVRRVLRPGGLLILGVPNEGCGWWQLAYRLQPKSRAQSDHVHFYVISAWRSVVSVNLFPERSGFSLQTELSGCYVTIKADLCGRLTFLL